MRLGLIFVLLVGCPTGEPPLSSWWDGPGAGSSADDDDSAPAGPDGIAWTDLVVVASPVEGGVQLDGVQLLGEQLVQHDLGRAEPQTLLQGQGPVIFLLRSGDPSTLGVGTFGPELRVVSHDLPANADPAVFVQATGCSLVVLSGMAAALVLPEGDADAPTFVPLAPWADDDGDPDALSAFGRDERLFVGLSRLGPAGPDPGGALALELDCSGAVLAETALPPGSRLLGNGDEAQIAWGPEGVFALDAEADLALGEPLLAGAVEAVALAATGAVWAVQDGALLCALDGGVDEVDAVTGEPLSLAASSSGRVALADGGADPRVRSWSTDGCGLVEGGHWELAWDEPPLDLASLALTPP